MANIGELLKEQRIKKGLSIEDIQEITKIRSRYIEAIEEGKLDKLPGRFYAKAFIKSYAEVVELTPSTLEEYQASIPGPELDEIVIKTNVSFMAKSPSKLGKWFMASLVYILIGIVILFGYMFLVNHISNPSDEDTPGTPIGENRFDVKEPTDEAVSDESGKEMESAPSETNINKIQINKLSTEVYEGRSKDIYEIVSSPETKIDMKLTSSNRCWYSIRVGGPKGKEILTGELNSGEETEVFSLTEQEIWIHLGYAAGDEIQINSEKIKAGDETDPKFISIIRK